jgi:hypothetical protein
MDSIEHQHHVSTHNRRGKWVFLGFAAIALFFLLSEHRAHFLGALPYLLVLACPLMHLFHHGHGHHDHGGAERPAAPAEPTGDPAGERHAR